ncbi:MAG: hypothetical protein J6U23_14745 [Clostridiales bacterium]|nr:hypothetical protein [Clostridiales bacterium]
MSSAENSMNAIKPNSKSAFLEFFKKRPLLTALTINFFSFLIRFLTMDIKYEVSDDHMQDALLSGAFGNGYDPYMLFSNPILGFFLKFFYQLIPTVSFYFLFMEVLAFISVTAIIYILLKKNMNIAGILLSVLFLLAGSDDIYVLVQFTKIAAVAGMAGGVLVLYGIFDAPKRKPVYIIIGTLITVSGSLLRFASIYISLIFLGLVFLYNAYASLKDSKGLSKETIKKIVIGFSLCVVLVGMLFGLLRFGDWLKNRNPEYKTFSDFQPYRSHITDIWVPSYDAVSDTYTELGYDETDYYMLNSWEFVDQSIYPNEDLEKVGSINIAVSDDLTNSVIFSIGDWVMRGTMWYWCTLCLYAMIIVAALNGKRLLWPFLVLLSTVLLLVCFIYTGRTAYRVEFSTIICAEMLILATFESDNQNSLSKKVIDAFGKKIPYTELIATVVTLIMICVHLPLFIPDSSQLSMSDEEYRELFNNTMLASGDFDKNKYRFRSADRKPLPNILNYIKSDDSHYYYVDLYTAMQTFYFNYDPWIRPEEGMFKDQYVYFGSVALHHPGEKYALQQHGIDPDNPFSALTDNSVFVVDTNFIDIKLAYVRKYYNPDAELGYVDTVDGYDIWKIFVPETVDEE